MRAPTLPGHYGRCSQLRAPAAAHLTHLGRSLRRPRASASDLQPQPCRSLAARASATMERAAPTQQSEVVFCCPRESQGHCLRTLLVRLYDISSWTLQLAAEEFCNLIAASLWASTPSFVCTRISNSVWPLPSVWSACPRSGKDSTSRPRTARCASRALRRRSPGNKLGVNGLDIIQPTARLLKALPTNKKQSRPDLAVVLQTPRAEALASDAYSAND